MPSYPEEKKADQPPVTTAQGRYDQLTVERSPYEKSARDASKLTIPTLVPPAGSNGATTLPAPYQSVGARGVNNLAAKLLLVLFPPGSVFFKLSASEVAMDQLKKSAGAQAEDVEGGIEAALSKIERAVTKKLGASNIRATLFACFKHLVVAGNALLVVLPNAQFKYFPLTAYVVKRDLSGTPIEIIAKEGLSRTTLPVAARAIVDADESGNYKDTTKTLDLFTWVQKQDDGSWKIHQEVCGKLIPGTEGNYPEDKSAWIPLRWTAISGEDYGRGHVEDCFGDLYSLESLSQSLIEGSAALAKIVFMVNESGVTSRKKIAEAQNLDVIDGDAKDVTVLRTDKAIDLNVAFQQSEKVERRLAQAFLLSSSVQRDAERVTAEEIRVMAGELEQTLGGVYSTFGQELQFPLITRLLAVMQKSKELPALPDKSITPTIITGLEGLGRSADLQRLDLFIEGLAQNLGPNAVGEYINAGAYAVRRAAALGLDVDGLVRSEQEVQATRQAAAQAQMAQSLGPDAIKANAARDIAAQKSGSPDAHVLAQPAPQQ